MVHSHAVPPHAMPSLWQAMARVPTLAAVLQRGHVHTASQSGKPHLDLT